ncbi:bifunctional UDP-N-acetylmuramoyl-tripeptide:D-alanyl-D-alanine ligase/alanine racemase [Fulvivirga lutimaris]|uniref:bifunctional UDP-N-acetylmuramoyl-tripeptide:D-alanyl-D-alanine ligase/alanine racemase n=1 Tax=Fulvivirga lutimaris TaxID=1819566 RepID=UPI0012BC0C4A|nr:bifunctional UDP-N-acetylmuramoyl-tripeptide:D-alanyl-D-alanine ligase/alanine racemase [Fulvivirga lutimaris]MTI39734.1 bifunctional UDP-N-acetylmuramoyl-tripeptide:D-alanyl-D-alanine ligase/alanine racemase [Fulvivirga lutimaris]
MRFKDIAEFTHGKVLANHSNDEIKSLIIDSRKAFISRDALFFAIAGEYHDSHNFLHDQYAKGVRNFVVQKQVQLGPEANVILVDNTISALQKVASKHRSHFKLPVIAITGSNGKTITKEWLFTCLTPFYNIVRSPKSFNSQVGVPLSLWGISKAHNLAIFEAGISQSDEMQNLEKVIQPSLGIFTNLGAAHDQGFESREQKLSEKAQLFENVETVIFHGDDDLIYNKFSGKAFCWGYKDRCTLKIISVDNASKGALVQLAYESENFALKLPFTDPASLENMMHCIATMLYLKIGKEDIQERINKLLPVNMRLELKKAIGNSYIIDDTYNNDLGGLQRAVEFLTTQQQKSRKVVIISDILQSGLPDEVLYRQVFEKLQAADVDLVIGIGTDISDYQSLCKQPAHFYNATDDFLQNIEQMDLNDSVILIKGARVFGLERIVKSLEEKIHGTVLKINLDALTNNLNFYRSKLGGNTKIMAMVKAFSYGSGSFEIANLMQYHRVDYLGVAYADEGVRLRENGIHLPIMVMNPSPDSFESIYKNNLEPEIYNLDLLDKYLQFLNGREGAIHLKIETGMKRLGFDEDEIDSLIQRLQSNDNLTVKSIFSHLAGADEAIHEQFSEQQAEKFSRLSGKLRSAVKENPILHLVNSPGILRYPQFHFDMVRLGIGLYGVEAGKTEDQKLLQPISELTTIISQLRTVKQGETVGYGRKGVADKDIVVATIAIGYADGFSRAFSQGKGFVWVNGQRASVIGNVCMDMTMIDVTDLNVEVGDQVEIFGNNISIIELADGIGTIPYEILTNVSQRVKRVYFTE